MTATPHPQPDALRATYRRLIHSATTQAEAAELLDAILTLGKLGYVLTPDETDWQPNAARPPTAGARHRLRLTRWRIERWINLTHL